MNRSKSYDKDRDLDIDFPYINIIFFTYVIY